MFGGGALFFFAMRGTGFGSTFGLLLGVLSAGMAALSVVGIVNLLRHEGWAVVLTEDALELPTAPYRSGRRESFPTRPSRSWASRRGLRARPR